MRWWPVLDDVLADVVQERGVLEQLAVGGAEAVELARSRRTARATSVATWRACASAQLQRRAGSSTALAADRVRVVGPVGGIVAADRVEHDALAQRPLARS